MFVKEIIEVEKNTKEGISDARVHENGTITFVYQSLALKAENLPSMYLIDQKRHLYRIDFGVKWQCVRRYPHKEGLLAYVFQRLNHHRDEREIILPISFIKEVEMCFEVTISYK